MNRRLMAPFHPRTLVRLRAKLRRSSRAIARAQLASYCFIVVLLLLVCVTLMRDAAITLDQTRHWDRSVGIIVDVVYRPAGGRTIAPSWRPTVVTMTPSGLVRGSTISEIRARGSWSSPSPEPRVGDTICVLVEAGGERRIIPCSAVKPFWQHVLTIAVAVSCCLFVLWLAAATALALPRAYSNRG